MTEKDPQKLSQNEIDEIMKLFGKGGGEVELPVEESATHQAVDFYKYDFTKPEKISKEQKRGLETLYESFTRNFQALLAARMRTPVSVRLASIEQVTYQEFINSLHTVTCFNILAAEELEGNFALELNQSIAYPIYERLMGSGIIRQAQLDRSLTEIEWKVIEDGAVMPAITEIERSWEAIKKMTIKIIRRESNPQLVPIMAQSELVLVTAFEIRLLEFSGYLNICMSVSTVEKLLENMMTSAWFGKKKKVHVDKEAPLPDSIAATKVPLSFSLPEGYIKFSDLSKISSGDEFRFPLAEGLKTLGAAGSVRIFNAKLGKSKDRYAVMIVQGKPERLYSFTIAEELPLEHKNQAPLPRHLVDSIPVDIVCSIADRPVKFSEVGSLAVDSEIVFPNTIGRIVELRVANKKIAEAEPGKVGDKFAVSIKRIA